MLTNIDNTVSFLRGKLPTLPHTAVILGSGLGGFVNEISDPIAIPYAEIPGFPVSTVEGHKGQLVFGTLGGQPILAMQGRFHYYEGYPMAQVTYPIRVMRELGIKTLFVSNAAGGLNSDFKVGDLMLITDHINFFPEHPLRGKNPYGDRFPDMSAAYDRELLSLARQIGTTFAPALKEGIYIGTQGPSFETPAELRMFRAWGADSVGMSTVPEVIVARHCGIRVFGVSVITNVCVPDQPQEASHEEVQQAADSAAPRMTTLIREMICRNEQK